jgi:hypothetical protein
MRSVILSFLAFVMLAGCVTTPDGGRQLTATGKVALQEVAAIGINRWVRESPGAAEKVEKVRVVLVELQALPDISTIAGLRAVVQTRIDAKVSDPLDRSDWTRLLNILSALLTDYVGDGTLDAKAVIVVRDFLGYLSAALPPAPPSGTSGRG